MWGMLGSTVKATGFALVVAGVIYVIIDFWTDVNTIRALAAGG